MTEKSAAMQALLNYQQADMDGVMVIVFRQAVHEVDDEIERLREALELAAPVACGAFCPSVKKTGEEWTHSPECEAIRAALKGGLNDRRLEVSKLWQGARAERTNMPGANEQRAIRARAGVLASSADAVSAEMAVLAV